MIHHSNVNVVPLPLLPAFDPQQIVRQWCGTKQLVSGCTHTLHVFLNHTACQLREQQSYKRDCLPTALSLQLICTPISCCLETYLLPPMDSYRVQSPNVWPICLLVIPQESSPASYSLLSPQVISHSRFPSPLFFSSSQSNRPPSLHIYICS